jgi:hypothetical protein
MIWLFVAHLLTLLLDLLTVRRRTERAKDLEIALLRQQLTCSNASSPTRRACTVWGADTRITAHQRTRPDRSRATYASGARRSWIFDAR